jgi:nucleotide-binding universal stress UspA family protein
VFNSIIVALDGSEESLKALTYARGIAECFGAKLFLVHAYPHTSELRDSSEYNTLVTERIKEGETIVAAARQRLGETSVEVEETVLEGPAADAILSVADARKADLIIMGSRGLGALKGALLGSVSTKVSHTAACPVMVVR